MQLLRKLFISLFICFAFQSGVIAASNGPICVKAEEATVFSLVVKSAKNKQFKETSSKYRKYTPLRLTGKKEGKYVEVQTIDGKNTWVRKKDLSTKFQCLVVRVKKTRLHKGPGTDYEPSELAEKGAVFLDKGGEDGWLQVENSEGVKAWINMDHVWKPTSTMRMSFENE